MFPTPCRCSGVASYQYTSSVGSEFLPREEERVVAGLPQEAPMPQVMHLLYLGQ